MTHVKEKKKKKKKIKSYYWGLTCHEQLENSSRLGVLNDRDADPHIRICVCSPLYNLGRGYTPQFQMAQDGYKFIGWNDNIYRPPRKKLHTPPANCYAHHQLLSETKLKPATCPLTDDTFYLPTWSSRFSSVRFSPLTVWVVEGHEGRFKGDFLPVCSGQVPFVSIKSPPLSKPR